MLFFPGILVLAFAFVHALMPRGLEVACAGRSQHVRKLTFVLVVLHIAYEHPQSPHRQLLLPSIHLLCRIVVIAVVAAAVVDAGCALGFDTALVTVDFTEMIKYHYRHHH